MKKASISKIRIYPIKSLGYVELEEAEVGTHALKNDRLFAMVDNNGRYMNGKRNSKVNQLKTEFDLPNDLIWLTNKENNERTRFELREGNEFLDNYLSVFFDTPLRLFENDKGDFMDIPKQSSLTVVSEASLSSIQEDMTKHSLENMRLRFRTNVELQGVDKFWEEQLYKDPGTGVHFKMGNVEMVGISPRQRCNVPPQDPNSGETDISFVQEMIKSRNKHETVDGLLNYGRASYFLTINVYIPKSEYGKTIKLGDTIEILKAVNLK